MRVRSRIIQEEARRASPPATPLPPHATHAAASPLPRADTPPSPRSFNKVPRLGLQRRRLLREHPAGARDGRSRCVQLAARVRHCVHHGRGPGCGASFALLTALPLACL